MDKLLTSWERLCGTSPLLRFADINLRGIGQVMFQDNPLSGALFLAAIGWGSFAAGVPQTFIAGLLGVIVATFTGQCLRVSPGVLNAGLCGYNGVLVGIALATFLAPGPLLWAYVVLGAAVSVIVTLAISNAVRSSGLSALTFPFVLTTWILLLASYGFAGLKGAALPSGAIVSAFQPYQVDPLNVFDLLGGVLQSISQVFLKGSGLAAVLLLIGLAINSVAAAVFALGGAIIGVLTAHLLGAESELITGGLLGFSPVLTAILLGTVAYRPGLRVAAYAAVAVVFTVIAQAALNVALTPFAIPALTAPFVIVSWLFLLPRQCLEAPPADASMEGSTGRKSGVAA